MYDFLVNKYGWFLKSNSNVSISFFRELGFFV